MISSKELKKWTSQSNWFPEIQENFRIQGLRSHLNFPKFSAQTVENEKRKQQKRKSNQDIAELSVNSLLFINS